MVLCLELNTFDHVLLSSFIVVLIFVAFMSFTLHSLGELSAVDNSSYSFINSSMVNISWKPPYTLPGTVITGYNVYVTSNGTTTDYFTSDSYYELQLSDHDITDSPCDEINTTVSGFNGLNGKTTSMFRLYLPSGTFS